MEIDMNTEKEIRPTPARRVVVPSTRVQMNDGDSRVLIPACESSQPRIRAIRDGGVIQAIDITCSCGEKIRVLCQYGDEQERA